MKLAVKLSIVVGSGALVIGLLASAATFALTKASLQKSIGSAQLELARQTMDKIDRLLHERLKDIQAIAEIRHLERAEMSSIGKDAGLINKMLSELTVLTGPWDRLYVANQDGVIVASSKPQDLGKAVRQNAAEAAAFQEALAGSTYNSDFLISQTTRKPTIIFAAPVRDRQEVGQPVIGALVGLFAWPALAEILDDVDAHAVLLNEQAVIISHNTHYTDTTLLLRQLHEHVLMESLKARRARSLVAPARHGFIPVETLASYAPQLGFLAYRGNGWGLILEVPTSVAFASARDTAVRHACVLIPLALLGSAVFLWLMVRVVVNPVVALTEVTRHVAAGDFSKRATVTSSDEIGELARTFNVMTEQVAQSQEALEEKVAQRTAALSTANDALQQEVAERKKTQEELANYSKIVERSNKELDDFTYIVSHDLKEPLRSIDAFSRFLEEELRATLDDEARGYLDRVRANAKRMQALIEDLLEVSRLSKRANQLETVNIGALVHEATARFEHVIQEKHVQIDASPDLPTLVCDRVRLTEVFANLISNAIKYSDKPACRIEISCRATADEYEFAVKDNGPGIEPQYFQKIFEIFQRLGKREDQEGTGVGLTIVKKVVELHHGRVWVESAVGTGTTFFFTIPKDEQAIRGKRKLGEILVDRGLVSQQAVDNALDQQRGSPA